jgi:hypothetical protein
MVCLSAAFVLLTARSGVLTQAPARSFPDTSRRIGVFADQLPGDMTQAQRQFAATHYAGSQKLTLDQSRPLRAINPNFLVLHYHLAMWQSAPNVIYVVDRNKWGNDYPFVTTHEDWFWHNPAGQRVKSSQDGKLLMNVSNPGFQKYWQDSIAEQVRANENDGVFLDSASPALLQWEARAPADARLSGTGVRRNTFRELNNRSWIAAWEEWMAKLEASMAAKGIALIPNVGALATTWDNTNYSLTAGIVSEGFCNPGLTTSDWIDAMNQTLALVARNKIVILLGYVESENDLANRRYSLANYLLVKGSRTFLGSNLNWYPEWDLDFGAARQHAGSVNALAWKGVYRRDFANGIVLVNPTSARVRVDLESRFKRVEPQGGGPIAPDGFKRGTIATTDVTRIDVPAKGAEILLR